MVLVQLSDSSAETIENQALRRCLRGVSKRLPEVKAPLNDEQLNLQVRWSLRRNFVRDRLALILQRFKSNWV